ncbi:MAG TPA: hypothetical protein VJI71_00975 [Candidatus Norongarragalinales archaeon]|nr:hypothetical protein [Candidatus Norongarragalinales archaeon]
MARFVAQESPLESLEKQLPNLIILVILVLALMVVLTKFQWIHCSQVPFVNWCGTYCSYVEQGKSRIGVLSGSDGIGDPVELRRQLTRLRGFTLVEPVRGEEFSAGLLRKFDLLVVEKFKTASTRQVDAVKGYLDAGGTVIWVGDAFSNQYVDSYDLILANQTNESYYLELIALNVTPGSANWDKAWNNVKTKNWYKYLYNQTQFYGFDVLEDYLKARYDGNIQTPSASLRVIDIDSLVLRGLLKEFDIKSTQFSKIVPDASGVNIIAQIITPQGSFTGIMETRYAGRIVYVSFPLEEVNSTTLLTNVIDYLAPC